MPNEDDDNSRPYRWHRWHTESNSWEQNFKSDWTKVRPAEKMQPEAPLPDGQLELPLVFSDKPFQMVVAVGDRQFFFGPYATLEDTQKAMDKVADMMKATNVVQGLNKVTGNWHGTMKADPYDDESKKWVVWSCYPKQGA